MAASEKLTAEDVEKMVPSGQQTKFSDRIGWATTHMKRAGLIERPRRGVYRLMPEGKNLLSQSRSRIDLKLLQQYPSYIEWKKQWAAPALSSGTEAVEQPSDSKETPDQSLDTAVRELRSTLEEEVLDRLRKAAPAFLERSIRDLLIKMGYGGGDPTMGLVVGGPGDGGIDVRIREDALGFDEVYVQAKKYKEGNNVGREELQKFAGAIDPAGTNKGVFVTTASFAQPAKDFVKQCPKRIILIDGKELARLMIHHGVGVQTRERYEIKRIDEDYFDEEGS